jgi:two-component system cell cycle response regulator
MTMMSINSNISGHILFISDTAALEEMINAYFKTYKFTYDQFTNVDEAVESFKHHQHSYDLIITDASTGGGGAGLMLASKIRQLSRTKRYVPILAVSEAGNESSRDALINAGCNDVIYQPFQTHDLASRANSYIINKQLLDKIDAQQEELNTITLIDLLTGLYNPHHLIEQASKFLPLAKRQSFPLSLIIAEIDTFPHIQETYGHQAGEIVLQCMGVLIKSTSRQEDIASKFGTSQFALLLPYCDKAGALVKAERLRSAISKLNPDNIQVTASFGIANIPEDATCDWDTLLDLTNKQLAIAKADGGNTISVA